jgi:hypothetical protein
MASPLLPPIFLLTNQLTLNDLEAVKAHVASLISGSIPPAASVPVAVEEVLLTPSQIRQEVLTFETRTAYKASWKKVVMRGHSGLVENVFGILEECYRSLRTKSSNPDGWKAARALGGRDTKKWQDFKLRVIKYLHDKGSFHSENGTFDDYEDTAGGCDEITWDAALAVLASAPTVE